MIAERVSLELDCLPLDQIRRVNLLADRFEKELRDGSAPSAESFIGELNDGSARLVLLRLLMLTEQELGRRSARTETNGHSPSKVLNAEPSPAVGDFSVEIDKQIPGYELVRELGRGGMGIVYLARQAALNRLVALKVIHHGPHDDLELRERFRREAELFARCRHRNLVRIHHVGEHAGHPYLVLEYAEGGSLDKLLDGTPWSPRRAAELVEPLALAIAQVHGVGIVHRDLKPANILLDAAGTPMVGDFGLAKLLDQDLRLTSTGAVLGTPSYMSPEQAEGLSRNVGLPTDVYALGAILFELLTGRPPFKGESAVDTLKQVREVEVVAPSRLQPNLPRDLETICLTCLAKEPGRRYGGAAELAEDLRRYLDGKTIKARRARLPERVHRWCRRNPWVAASIMLLVGSLVVVSLLLWKADRAEQAARKSATEAVNEADNAHALTDFFLNHVLARADAREWSPGTKPDPDLKVRTALDRAAEEIPSKFAGKHLVEAAIRQAIGDSYMALGLYSQARPHLERSRELFLEARGVGHSETLEASRMLAQLYYELEKSADAERLILGNLETARRKFGKDDPEFFKVEHDVSVLYDRQGKLAEAEPFLTHALEGFRRRLGNRHEWTLNSLQARVALYIHQQRFAEAEQSGLELVEARRASRGDDHPNTLSAKFALASAYAGLKKDDLAEKTWIEVLYGRERVLGPKHPATLEAMNNLATFYFDRRDEKAEGLFVQMLEFADEVLGKDHPMTLLAMNNLSRVYAVRNKCAESEPILVRLLESRRRLLDWNQPETVTGMILAVDNLSSLRLAQAKPKEAEPLIEMALELRIRKLGESDPETVEAREHLGRLVFFLGDHAKAESLFEKVLRYRQRELGIEHETTITILDFLGESQLPQKKYPEAERSARESIKVHARVAPNTWKRFAAQARLGAALLGQMKHVEAERELLEAYGGLKDREATIPGKAAEQLQRVAGWLVELYEALDDKDKTDLWRSRRGG
jgi:serine/threonine protein kinase/tetratricopeptide (TPR) repeat protein